MEVKLYIDNVLVDLFNDESIEILINNLDVDDFTKRKADYTKSFKIPASKTNNRLFKHYYNFDVLGQFNANIRKSGRIEIGGRLFREGVFSLNGVSMKEGKPVNYGINFFSNEVVLSDIFGDDTLADITPSIDILFNTSVGLTNVNDICFSLFSNKQLFYGATGDETNEDELVSIRYNGSTSGNFITSYDLKPSIKATFFLGFIESNYNITFESDFFSNELFTELFFTLKGWDGAPDDLEVLQNSVQISELMPDIKVKDFIKSILSLFNATLTYFNDVVVIESKEAYYSRGKEVNISNYIDIGNTAVKKLDAPSEINYKFKESSTAIQEEFYKANNYYYGDLKEPITDEEGNAYTGASKTVNLESEVVLPEKLKVFATSTETPIQYCFASDDVFMFHYVQNVDLSGFDIGYKTNPTAASVQSLSNINIPLLSRRINDKYTFGLVFNNEIDTYSGLLLERNIFTQFHYNSTLSLYVERNRVVELNSVLPYSRFIEINKNDTIVINNQRFLISSINYNLLTNRAKLKLTVKINELQYPFITKGEFSNSFSNSFFK